ncbi:MAG: EAL domain-containing protein [Pseudomonadota bacterium]|nr:EAL domain-containing protein [Pseudomonadota bacterium]
MSASDTVKLQTERDHYVAFSFCWADALVELAADYSIAFAAGALGPLVGCQPEELIGEKFEDLVAQQDRARILQLLKIAQVKGRVEDFSIRLQGPRGTTPPMAMAAHSLDSRAGRFSIAFRLRPTEMDQDQKLGLERDESSGLYDTESFGKIAEQKLETFKRSGADVKMTVMSLPQLKELQERLGVDENESLMHSVGAFLKANSADGDTAARVDDESFSLIHEAAADIDKLEKEIAELTKGADPEGKGVEVETATIDATDESISDDEMAKGLMYSLNHIKEATSQGLSLKGLEENFGSLAREGAERIQNFRKVVEAGAFDPAFLPIINLKTGKIHHYEALVRFHDQPKEESPFREITFAEESGLIHEFDIMMVQKVIDWLSKKPRNSNAYNVAVNVSGNSIENDQYLGQLDQLLKENDWTKGKLCFEITESAQMSNLGSANNFIQRLRDEEYKVCLDDFGAGSASFHYLSTLDVDIVKLDGSAVKNAEKSKKGRAFLSALTELCRRLDVETVGEMIDSPQTLAFVRDCKVDYVQGFLFGKPSHNLEDFDPLPHRELMSW